MSHLRDRRLPDNPGDAYGHSEDWPCGCEWTAGGMGFRPCKAHEEMNLSEEKLFELLGATFPDLELPAEPPGRDWPDFDPET